MLMGADQNLDETALLDELAHVKDPRVAFAYMKHMWKDGRRVRFLCGAILMMTSNVRVNLIV